MLLLVAPLRLRLAGTGTPDAGLGLSMGVVKVDVGAEPMADCGLSGGSTNSWGLRDMVMTLKSLPDKHVIDRH